MADLFQKQADKSAEARPSYPPEFFESIASNYAEARPSYPPELFEFIASKTPNHDLAWDVGTGNGQAAVPLAGIFKKVIATDASQEQLSLAAKLPNIHYQHCPDAISRADFERDLAPPATVDLITVATAIHWFNLPEFYDRVNFALRRPHGVLAAWSYKQARVDSLVDTVYLRLYKEADPFFAKGKDIVEEEYRTLEFPFDPVEGMENTGPIQFVSEKAMNLDMYLTNLRSWSAYQTAKGKGIELLTERMVDEFEKAWGGDRTVVKAVKFPLFLKIGKVRISE